VKFQNNNEVVIFEKNIEINRFFAGKDRKSEIQSTANLNRED
jgi:hypothetical protein